jgi:hypothetical protein
MMKVHRYVMHVGYSKYSFLRGKEMGYWLFKKFKTASWETTFIHENRHY